MPSRLTRSRGKRSADIDLFQIVFVYALPRSAYSLIIMGRMERRHCRPRLQELVSWHLNGVVSATEAITVSDTRAARPVPAFNCENHVDQQVPRNRRVCMATRSLMRRPHPLVYPSSVSSRLVSSRRIAQDSTAPHIRAASTFIDQPFCLPTPNLTARASLVLISPTTPLQK
jgi:hypothetical protein